MGAGARARARARACVRARAPLQKHSRLRLPSAFARSLARARACPRPHTHPARAAPGGGVELTPELIEKLQELLRERYRAWIDESIPALDGLSPRAAIAVLRVARARAMMAGRHYVAPDDVQTILPQAIAHRLVPVPGTGRGPIEQVRAMVETVPIP